MSFNINNPCPEKWENMQAVEGGAFCRVCNKKVHDFTKSDAEKISMVLRQNEENNTGTCGRMNSTQLLELNFDSFFARFNLWAITKRIALVIFLGFGLSLFSCSGDSEHTVGEMEQVGKVAVTDTDTAKAVKDSAYNENMIVGLVDSASAADMTKHQGQVTPETEQKKTEKEKELVQENKNHPPPLPLAPSYKEGKAAMEKIISTNTKYPEAAKKAGISGTVYVKFMIGADGKARDFKVQTPLGYGCDEEAIRVAKLLKNWNPGKMNGKASEMEFGIGVTFKP